MRKQFPFFLILLLALTCAPCVAQTADTSVPSPATTKSAKPLPLTPANVAKYFAAFQRECHADGGKLWGISLCGPMLFVSPVTRHVVASQADADGRLKPASHGMFTGVIPADQPIANYSARWSGTRWIELLWPLPANPAMARMIMAHESYHRVQAQIVPLKSGGTNTQLQTVYGRYTLQLEFRALAAAVQAQTDAARRQAASDALLFRAARYHRFPKAQAKEVALERNEGLAQYTGVMVANASLAQRKAMALDLLRTAPKRRSFVRSFAYLTGPAYGLLLNRYRSGWRKQITHSKQGLAAMLASALHLNLAHMPLDTFVSRAAHYGGPALLAAEAAHHAKLDRKLAHYRSILISGPVLVLPLKHMRMQFDPRTVLSLGKAGTVYPTIRVFDVWGSIDVSRGALMSPNYSRLTVSAPSGKTTTGTIHGPGWALKLAPGWKLKPAAREGDFTLRHETGGKTHGK